MKTEVPSSWKILHNLIENFKKAFFGIQAKNSWYIIYNILSPSMGPYEILTLNEAYQNTILHFIGFQIRRIKINIISYNSYILSYNNLYFRCQMISVGDKIYLNGIITKQNENPLSDIWAFCPAKGEIDSNAGKLERPTCMNCCIRKFSSFFMR